MLEQIENVVLQETARERYLNYALSVITARALPDVRDGLKPVQRRILYAMYHGLRLLPDTKPRKSAAVVGEVMAKYHPHGDQSIYDAMVRMAQSFSLRYPLVEGQGNFGSLDGDPAAAMRYTETRLRHLAVELASELGKRTVDYRPNYDGTLFEPEVLPAQFPNLLVNGASGIAVGMATNIPPHNLVEVVNAAIALIDNPHLELADVVGTIVLGPDFPTGPSILADRATLLELYETGQGSLTMRGNHHLEGRNIIVTTLPYGVNKSNLIGDIAEHIRSENVPQLVDVRDESTDDIRIVLELRRGAEPHAAMAFLYKRTALEARFAVNLNALVPTGQEAAPCQPRRLGLLEVLRYFLDFRREVTRRRLGYDLEQLEKRIHLLRAFEIIFLALDEALQLIRSADDKGHARDRLMSRFELDYDQGEAVLETKLFKLAKLEIDGVRKELNEKEAEAAAIRAILASETEVWRLIRGELSEIRHVYNEPRRCRILDEETVDVEFNPEDYIVAEDAFVMVSRHGRLKRQKSYTELSGVRVPEGDQIGWVMPASTTETLILFTDRGKAYSMRVADVPATTGYGEPVQTRFDFADGERVVGVITSDPRCLPTIGEAQLALVVEGDPKPPYTVAITRGGRCLRLSLAGYNEPSTRAGRLFMRLDSRLAIDGVVGVYVSDGTELVSLATHDGRVLLFEVAEIKVLGGPGKGVQAIKLDGNDYVLGWVLTSDKRGGLTVETNRGRVEVIRPSKYQVTRRGNRGRELIKRGFLARAEIPPVEIALPKDEEAAHDGAGDDAHAGADESGAHAAVEGATDEESGRSAPLASPAHAHGRRTGLNGHSHITKRQGQGDLFGARTDDENDEQDD